MNKGKRLVFHLFIKKIPFEDFVELEKRSLTAKDFGSEVSEIVFVFYILSLCYLIIIIIYLCINYTKPYPSILE